MENLSLEVRSLSDVVPVEGPIPLSRTLTYHGEGQIVVASNELIDVTFEPPAGWSLKEAPKRDTLSGISPTSTLDKGQSLSSVIYLHDYFSQLMPGAVEIAVTVEIAPYVRGASELVVLRDVCSFTVLEPDPERFQERIEEIARSIESEPSGEKRLELYRSLGSLSHPDLVRVFINSLLDPAMLMFHATARKRLVELGEVYEKRTLIINHLANHGGRYDVEFFRRWRQLQIQLSEEEIARLGESSSVWIRLFCLERYKGQYNRKGLIESLKTELEEMIERVHKLENDQ